MINIILYVTIILIIWFNSTAFIEYCKLVPLFYKLFKVDDFYTKYESDFDLTYLLYLRQYHSCFFVKLITCPICLGFWLSLIATFFTNGNYFENFPIITFSSWMLYYMFNKVSK